MSTKTISRNNGAPMRGLMRHAAIYAVVITALMVFNILRAGGITWAIWPALGWGIGLIYHASRVFQRGNPS